MKGGAALGLLDFNAIGECILKLVEMRDDEYFCKIVFHEIDCYDEIELEQHTKLTMTADSILVPIDGSNLCLSAATLLQKEKHVRQGVMIHLKKNIPVGAGLGGGLVY